MHFDTSIVYMLCLNRYLCWIEKGIKDGWLGVLEKRNHEGLPSYYNDMNNKCWVAELSVKCACQDKLKYLCPING